MQIANSERGPRKSTTHTRTHTHTHTHTHRHTHTHGSKEQEGGTSGRVRSPWQHTHTHTHTHRYTPKMASSVHVYATALNRTSAFDLRRRCSPVRFFESHFGFCRTNNCFVWFGFGLVFFWGGGPFWAFLVLFYRESHQFLSSAVGFRIFVDLVLLDFPKLINSLLGFRGLYRVLLGFTGFHWVSLGFCWASLRFTG